MLFTTYNPLSSISQIQRHIDRTLEQLEDGTTYDWQPSIEIKNTPESFVIRALIPDLDTKTLEIQATQKSVKISGKVQQPETTETEQYIYSEFPVGKFDRVLNFRVNIVNTAVTADYKDSVLTLTLPKAPESINRVVKVSLPVNVSEKSEASKTES